MNRGAGDVGVTRDEAWALAAVVGERDALTSHHRA